MRQQAVCYILDIFQEMSSHLCFEHLCWRQVPTILKHLRADWFLPQYAVENFQFHPQHWDQDPAMVQNTSTGMMYESESKKQKDRTIDQRFH